MKPYQVKVSLKRDNGKYKPYVITGVVIATSQEKAVRIAMENIMGELQKAEEATSARLISANPLGGGFLYFEQVERKIEEKIEEKTEKVVKKRTTKKTTSQ